MRCASAKSSIAALHHAALGSCDLRTVVAVFQIGTLARLWVGPGDRLPVLQCLEIGPRVLARAFAIDRLGRFLLCLGGRFLLLDLTLAEIRVALRERFLWCGSGARRVLDVRLLGFGARRAFGCVAQDLAARVDTAVDLGRPGIPVHQYEKHCGQELHVGFLLQSASQRAT